MVAQPRDHLKLGAGWLDNPDDCFGSVVGNRKVLRPHAIDCGPAFGTGRRGGKRQANVARPREFQCPVRSHDALEKIHCRRADEAGDEQIVRPVIQFERSANLLDPAIMHGRSSVSCASALSSKLERRGWLIFISRLSGLPSSRRISARVADLA
jgi:hypothetical protein